MSSQPAQLESAEKRHGLGHLLMTAHAAGAASIPAEFVTVGLLKGAAVFVADLVRALNGAGARPRVKFMRLSSYGPAKESSGMVQLLGDVPAKLCRATGIARR